MEPRLAVSIPSLTQSSELLTGPQTFAEMAFRDFSGVAVERLTLEGESAATFQILPLPELRLRIEKFKGNVKTGLLPDSYG